MPFLSVIEGEGSKSRRILKEYLLKLEQSGYVLQIRQEGGDWSSLLSSFTTKSLFGGKSLAVVEEAELLGKFPETLAYLVDPESDSGIVLLYEGKYRSFFPKKILDLMENIKEKPVPEWNDQRERWLMDLAENSNVKIERKAVSLLVAWIDDPEELRSELEKLNIASFGGRVTEDMVKTLTLDEGRKSLLGLLDGLSVASIDEVLRNMKILQKNGTDILYVIGAVYNRIRLSLYSGHFVRTDSREIDRVLKARNYQRKMAFSVSSKYNPGAIDRLGVGLMGLSYREKTGKSSGWKEFERLVLNFMAHGRK